MVQIARRFVEFENEMYCQIGGIVSPSFSVFSGLNIHEINFVGILRPNTGELEISDRKICFGWNALAEY
jgi:hypothetical protein